MYSPSLEFLISPFENVVNLLGGVPQGHEKALKHGLYNSLALFLLIACLAAGWALYIILEPFFKPLVWALLCGSVLYPFKYSLSKSLHGWISGLSDNSTPLLLGIIAIPIQLIDDASDKLGDVIMKYIKYLIACVIIAICFHVVYNYTPHICICLIWQLGKYGYTLITWMIGRFSIYMIVTILIGYITVLTMYWRPELSRHFRYAACAVWMMISMYVASLTSPFQVSIFFTMQMLLAVGFLYEAWLIYNNDALLGKGITFFDAVYAVTQGSHLDEVEIHAEDLLVEKEKETQVEKNPEFVLDDPNQTRTVITETYKEAEDLIEDAQKCSSEQLVASTPENMEVVEGDKRQYGQRRPVVGFTSLSSNYKPRRVASVPIAGRSLMRGSIESQIIAALHSRKSMATSSAHSEISVPETPDSTKFLYGLLWACGLFMMWIHMWILHAVPILLLVYLIKHTGHYFGVWQMIGKQMQCFYDILTDWCHMRHEALFPIPVSGVFKLLLQLNLKILEILKDCVDMAASTVVILSLIILTISTVVFLAVQMYSESILLLQMGSSAINNTFVNNSQLIEFLPEGWQSQMDSVLDDAYSYGRQGISKLVQQFLKGVDPAKGEHLEKQVLELWDRIYQAWMTSNSQSSIVGPTVSSSAVFASWDNIIDGVQKTPELFNMGGVVNFLQDNVGTLLTVWESVWGIFRGNITLAVDSCTAIVAILFGGGTAVINFIVNLVVFFTALFYLLTSSGDMYKPVDLISNFSPTSGNRLAVALEDAIASVFKASFKRAVISGLWTWLIHNLFQVKLIYIPSVFATLFGAIPFIGTYWASLPAMLELYLGQDRGLHAVLLLVVQFVAASMVDSTVYKEIKGGGHPYLTGLSIAGGLFCLGAEGVILGPLLLCALYVGINMSTTFMSASPSESEVPEHLSELNQLNQIRMGRM